MLGMFLNSADADRVSHDLHVQTLEDYADATQSVRNRINMRLQAHQQWENKLDAAYRQIAAMQEKIEILTAEGNAETNVIRELVDVTKPENKYAIRKIRSRKLDEELDRLLAKGYIKNDPRSDPEWVDLMKYVSPSA